MKIHQYFDAEEFVHPDIWNQFGWPYARWFISDFQINYAVLLRETLQAPVILNTWHLPAAYKGTRYVGRGTRPRKYKPKNGAEYSMHYLSLALDASSTKYTNTQMFQAIMDNRPKFLAIGLTTIENTKFTPGWLHGDSRPRIAGVHPKDGGFLIVQPKGT